MFKKEHGILCCCNACIFSWQLKNSIQNKNILSMFWQLHRKHATSFLAWSQRIKYTSVAV
jgi:hypothetical protein